MATVEKYQTKSGGTLYAVRYRKPDRGTTTKRGFRTKREAQAWAEDVEIDKRTGSYVAPSLGRITVAELSEAWLARKKQSVAPSSYHSMQSAYKAHVAPAWGRAPVADIDTLSIESWITTLSKKGLSAASVIRVHGVLAGILQDGVKGKRLAVNPARGIENLPRKTSRRHVYLSDDDVARLADESGQHRALVLTLAYCGVRWGEAIALRVRDVEFLRRRIAVHENAVQIGSRHAVGPTKGHENRSVPVPEFVLDELSVQCAGKNASDLVFPGRSGYLPRPDSATGWFVAAVKRAGVETITPHDLRHTCASLAVSAGANVLALARMLGHKDPSMTLRTYADLFDTDLDALADTMHARYSHSNVLTACSPGAHEGTKSG